MKFLLIALAMLILLWLVARRRGTGKKGSEAPVADRRASLPSAGGSEYHAVSIRFESDACAAAKALSGRRYLAGEAPKLPLDDCDAAECSCRFVHHADRRSGRDRRSPFNPSTGPLGSGKYERERRAGKDRRDDPEDPWS